MCLISSSGIIAYRYKNGAYNSESFVDFITDKLFPHFSSHPNHVFIVYNCRFHKSRDVLDLLRTNNITYKSLTPYSSELNPTEEFFSVLKSNFCAFRFENKESTIEQCLDTILGNIEVFSAQCRYFYNGMLNWLEKAKIKELLI